MGFVGMATEQAREHAESIRTAARRLEDERSVLADFVQTGLSSWVGPDADAFRRSWTDGAGVQLIRAVDSLEHFASVLDAEVEEQEDASSPDAAGPDADGPGGRQAGGSGPPGARFGGGGDGDVSPEVARAWAEMSEEEREKVLQEVVNQELARQGLPPLEVYYADLEDDGLLGYWIEHPGRFWRGEHIVIDEAHAADPDSLNTVVHEVRHAAQNEWIEQTEEPPGWQFWREDDSAEEIERLEREYGVTPEELEAWRENDKDYKSAPGEYPGDDATQGELDQWWEEYRRYREQPLEEDAFETGDEFADDLTLEELQQYQEDAGVPVTS